MSPQLFAHTVPLHGMFACSNGLLGLRAHARCHKTTLTFVQELFVGRNISFAHDSSLEAKSIRLFAVPSSPIPNQCSWLTSIGAPVLDKDPPGVDEGLCRRSQGLVHFARIGLADTAVPHGLDHHSVWGRWQVLDQSPVIPPDLLDKFLQIPGIQLKYLGRSGHDGLRGDHPW
jgi:hypothetical protein